MNSKIYICFFLYTFLYLLSGCVYSDSSFCFERRNIDTLFSQNSAIINPQAFSHNDYLQHRPLVDALLHGFVSIEADVFLLDGKLVVTHFFPFFKGNSTLESLYLDPLYQLFLSKRNLKNPRDNKPIILMIDIKSFSKSTYTALKKSLQGYRRMLTSFDSGMITERAVTVVISGNKPQDIMANELHRLAFIDQDLEQIERSKGDSTLNVMASAKYSQLISWQGDGEMTIKEEKRLRKLVQAAHLKGIRVRLWASPEEEVVWNKLLSCGVDMISTDSLLRLQKYLTRYNRN